MQIPGLGDLAVRWAPARTAMCVIFAELNGAGKFDWETGKFHK